jgi:RNA polymerase sigma-70 factor, ECF subfamily
MNATLSFYMDGLYGYAMDPIGRLREDSNTKAWLYTILRNIRLNQLHQQRSRPRLLTGENTADLFIETSKDHHALHVSKVEREQMREAIQQLSAEFREIIVLREFAELSYQEIATLLDYPPGTVTPGKSALQTPNLTSYQ